MALLSNYPFVLAPGMGLNAYFAYTVVLGMGYNWQQALAAVFVAVSYTHLFTPFLIRSMGTCIPITPVEATSTLSAATPRISAAASAVSLQSVSYTHLSCS